jgi:hypothetical protein
VEDAFWSTPEVSMSHSNQQGDLSARELQEAADYQKALDKRYLRNLSLNL